MGKYQSCSFTGHRPHKFPWRYNETDSRCTALKTALAEQITSLAEAGVTAYYGGGADGVDWSDSAQERYRFILSQADSLEYVSHDYYDGCMLDRNRRLVDAADLLLAVYNGERRGGTAATVRYARKLGRRVIIVDPILLKIVKT